MPKSLHVKNYLNPKFVTLKPEQYIKDVIFVFNKQNIFGAPVMDNLGNLVGVLSGSDCIQAAIEGSFDQNSHLTVSELMTRDVKTVESNYSILFIAKEFMNTPYRFFPVMDDNRVVGVISRSDILRAISDAGSSLT